MKPTLKLGVGNTISKMAGRWLLTLVHSEANAVQIKERKGQDWALLSIHFPFDEDRFQNIPSAPWADTEAR